MGVRSDISDAGRSFGKTIFQAPEGVKKFFKGADTSEEDAAALDALIKQSDIFDDLPLPEISTPDFTNYSNVSQYTPQDYDVETVGPSAYGDIVVDPRLAGHQMASLEALSAIASGGGLTAADRAQLAQIQSEVAQADRGRREAILQQQAARGMAGSGNELLAQLQSSQAATNRASQAGLDVAGMAQQRAMDAIMQRGQLAGSIRGQEFGEGAQKAAASDAIAKFNANNVNDGRRFSAGQETDARKFHSEGAQSTSDKNTAGINTQEQQRKLGIPQQQFDNRVQIATGQAGGLDALVDYYTGKGDRKVAAKANDMSAILKGAGMAAAAFI